MSPLAKHTDSLDYILSKMDWIDGPGHKSELYYDVPLLGKFLIKGVWYTYNLESLRNNGNHLYFLYRDNKVVGTFILEMWGDNESR